MVRIQRGDLGLKLGVDEVHAPALHLFPDPANDVLHIGSGDPIAGITIIDITGRVVKGFGPAALASATIEVREFPAGSYAAVITGRVWSAVERFTIAR